MLIQNDPPENAGSRAPFYHKYPPVLLVLVGSIISVSLVQFLATPELEDGLLRAGALLDRGQYDHVQRPFGPYASYVLHTFLHGGVLHLGMNMWVLLSFGAVIAMALGGSARGIAAFLAFFFFCAIGGAAAQDVLFQFQVEGGYAIGASSAISGLLPALGWLQGRWRRAIRISLPWVVINLGLAVFGHLSPIAIAWAAHLGGLAAGFAFPLFFRWTRG